MPFSFWSLSEGEWVEEWVTSQDARSAESRLSGRDAESTGVRERVSPFERMLLLSVSGFEMAEEDIRREW
jgi:hypothetical protein